MKQTAFVVAVMLIGSTVQIGRPTQANAANRVHLHVGETVYAASSAAIGYALCEAPEGANPWLDGFPKPKLDANHVPKVIFSYRSGDPLKVVAMRNYTWTYEGARHAEKLWAMETRDRHRFCLRDAQVDDSVVEKRR